MTTDRTIGQVKTYYGKSDRPVHVSLKSGDGRPGPAPTLCGRSIDAVTVIGLASQITCCRCAKTLDFTPETGA